MEGRWCSLAEVAADVWRAGGGAAPPAPRAAPPAPLADACLAWGARPAPLILTEPALEEAGAGAAAAGAGAGAPPDLRGITRMLRMVQTEDTDVDSAAAGDVVISKPGPPPAPPRLAPPAAGPVLNPDVAEFVPRSAPHLTHSPHTPHVPSPASREPNDDEPVVTEESAGCGEREELAARLREDISGGEGRDRCSAIARLMRLYAQPPPPAPRLLTPDYFQGAPLPPAPGNASRATETASERIETLCVPRMMSERESAREAEPRGGEGPSEVRASVDKVRRWLAGGEAAPPRARASPRLLLAPVTFRPRGAPASPARTPPPPAPRAAPAAREYSPRGEAAAALHREYAARAAAARAARASPPPPAAARAADTLWSRLEAQLLQKDEERRARAAPAPAPAPAP